MKTGTGNNANRFRVRHEFDAPQQLVFEAFSTADALNAWWGPEEMSNSVISFDFRTGGVFHFKMEQHGILMYGRFVFGKIEPYSYLEFTNAFADAMGNVIDAPFGTPFPRQIQYQLRFSEFAGKTTIELTGTPVGGDASQLEGFSSFAESMNKGFSGMFNKLTQFLIR